MEVPVQRLPKAFSPQGTYLVTGAAGGFGSVLVRALYERGARHFVLTVTTRWATGRAGQARPYDYYW